MGTCTDDLIEVKITANAYGILQMDTWGDSDGTIPYRDAVLRELRPGNWPRRGSPAVVRLSRKDATELLDDAAWWLMTYREQARGYRGYCEDRDDARRLAPFVASLRAVLED